MNTLQSYFDSGLSFAGMAAASAEHGTLLVAQRERAVVPDDLLARTQALTGQFHLLAISEDWCIDSQSILPVIAEFADRAGNLDLRIVGRDANPELIDAHLTNGTARSVPVIIVLDADYLEQAWWGPRPAPLQQRVSAEWKALEKPERNKEIRRWYAIDKGRASLTELVQLLEQVAARQPESAIAGS
ncbi:MAG: thioredoxin family protein [Gemmatimonadota bacterium]